MPFPSSVDQEIEISKTEKIIIEDVLTHNQEFIRQTKAKVLHPITSKDIASKLSNFTKVFSETLNTLYQKENLNFHLVDAGSLHNNNFLYVAFCYDDKPDFTFSEESQELPISSEAKLQELLTLDKGYAKFTRILKIYKKDYVCFIKPNQLRYWLDSVALRDADWVLDDLVKNGH